MYKTETGLYPSTWLAVLACAHSSPHKPAPTQCWRPEWQRDPAECIWSLPALGSLHAWVAERREVKDVLWTSGAEQNRTEHALLTAMQKGSWGHGPPTPPRWCDWEVSGSTISVMLSIHLEYVYVPFRGLGDNCTFATEEVQTWWLYWGAQQETMS